MSTRPSWDVYFLEIALKASERATCPRRHVGSVLVRDKAIVATGYNGAVRGLPHCEDVGCGMIDGHCETTVHAEANAIAAAARQGARTEGATAYVTAFPCSRCFHLLVNAGIVRIVYGSPYVDRAGDTVRVEAAALGLPLVELLGVVPAPAARAAEDGAVAPTGGALRVGMGIAEVRRMDFGPCPEPNNNACACYACDITGSLICACGELSIDHYDDGQIAPHTGTRAGPKGCNGFSLATWKGGPLVASQHAPPKRSRRPRAPASST